MSFFPDSCLKQIFDSLEPKESTIEMHLLPALSVFEHLFHFTASVDYVVQLHW